MVSCEVICDLMPVYASGEASPETERLVGEHLARCPTCRAAFREEGALDEALAALESGEQPSNGGQVITRTRRLLFAVSVGALTLLACLLVTLQRVVIEGIAAISLPRLPGPSLPWLAVAVLMLGLYVALLLWRGGQAAGRGVGQFILSLLAATPLLVLMLVIYQLAGAGSVLLVALAGLLLLIAVGATYGLLPRVPYATITTALVLLLVTGLLIGEVFAGVVALGDFSWETPAQLGHPRDALTAEEAARVDLTPLGLTRVESTEPAWLNNVWIGSRAEAARAAYEGEHSGAFLTVVRFEGPQRADAFFASWQEAVSEGVEIAHWEINLPGLPGQGRIFRAYEPGAGKAYSAWQNEGWVTIIEVAGPLSRAMPLAREIKEAVAGAYQE